jgi:hypothetical protein
MGVEFMPPAYYVNLSYSSVAAFALSSFGAAICMDYKTQQSLSVPPSLMLEQGMVAERL